MFILYKCNLMRGMWIACILALAVCVAFSPILVKGADITADNFALNGSVSVSNGEDPSNAFDADESTQWSVSKDQLITIKLNQSQKINQVQLIGTGLDHVTEYAVSAIIDGQTKNIYVGDTNILFETQNQPETWLSGILTETATFDTIETADIFISLTIRGGTCNFNEITVGYNPWPETLLKYPPPVLEDPEIIFFNNSNSQLALSKQTKRGDVAGRDFIIVPSEVITAKNGMDFYGSDTARHVVMIGGEIAVENSDGRRAIRTHNFAGMTYVEGLWAHGSNLAEVFNVDCREIGSSFVCQNLRVDNMTGTREEQAISYKGVNHPDLIQNYGGPTYLYVDRLTGITNYQGYMIQPLQYGKNRTKIYKSSNVNMIRTGKIGYQVFLSSGGTDVFDMSDNIWLDDRYGVGSMTYKSASGGKIEYPNPPWDRLNGGLAPYDFAVGDTEENGGVGISGMGYVSPGYAFWEELPIDWTRQDFMKYINQPAGLDRDRTIQAAMKARREALVKVSSGEETRIHAVDGKDGTYWTVEGDDNSPYLRIDLRKAQDIRQITIQQAKGDSAVVSEFVIEVTNDTNAFASDDATESAWHEVYRGKGDLRNGIDILPEQISGPVNGRYWQLRIISKSGSGSINIDKFRVTSDVATGYLASEVYKVNNRLRTIDGVTFNDTTVKEFIDNLNYRGVITVKDAEGRELKGDEVIGEKCMVSILPLANELGVKAPNPATSEPVVDPIEYRFETQFTVEWLSNGEWQNITNQDLKFGSVRCRAKTSGLGDNGKARMVVALLQNGDLKKCFVSNEVVLAEDEELIVELYLTPLLINNAQLHVYLWNAESLVPLTDKIITPE